MKKTITMALALSFLVSGLALASGPSSPARDSFGELESLTVTETIRCVVTEVKADGTVLVRDSDGRPAHALPFTKKTRFVAQDKSEFDGRKKIAAADLKVGQQLKVTVRPATMEVMRVKVLKKG